MSRKRRVTANCSICGMKRLITFTILGRYRHAIKFCRHCSIRRQCIDLVRDLPEKQLKEVLADLERRVPECKEYGLTDEGLQRLRDRGLIL